ncbi:MAG: hypothetical protein A2Y07_00340 [Planctomycetes bacterium GWF2_50_10]|nr:MAG: hypothetical protein A2Y07_00340 [Planctomycetes bacterium GWF2_50_10]
MLKRVFAITIALVSSAMAFDLTNPNNSNTQLVKLTIEKQYDVVRPGSESLIAVQFDIDRDWHFYASKEDAPGGAALSIEPNAPAMFNFAPAIFPAGQEYNDPITQVKTHILTGKFTAYIPFKIPLGYDLPVGHLNLNFKIRGALCSKEQCRMINLAGNSSIILGPKNEPAIARFELPTNEPAKVIKDGAMQSYSTLAALGLAFIAGLILNIMPCVLPVIPLKVLSIFEQAKESKWRCITLGLAFCAGILLFFAVLGAANIFLRLSLGIVFQWGDHFRNPAFVAGMAILMEVLALVMFGVATVHAPVITGNAQRRGGYVGSAGMGFLAALLSTPCSFAILTAAFAWAQAQTLWLGTIAIMIIGIGMAAPYAILTSMPSLLKHLPRPGRWMEIFKQAMGFVLLVVAVWLMSILPAAGHTYILYFAVVVAFCVWMWGNWADHDANAAKRFIVRLFAVVITAIACYYLLMPALAARPQDSLSKQGSIEWQKYDPTIIASARAQDRPVLIEWTADWCLTCKGVEQTVYARRDIQELIKLKNVLTIKADTTWAANQAAIDLQKIYNEPGVPVQMIFVPQEPEPVRFHGLIIGEQMKKILEEL